MTFFKHYKYPLAITLSLIAIFFVFQNGTCAPATGPNYQMNSTIDSGISNLTVSATQSSIAPSGTLQLQVAGGTPPYQYIVLSGGGSVDSNGLYTAPNNETTALIEAVDSMHAAVGTFQLNIASPVIQPLSSLSWESTGSGQLSFTLTPSGNDYLIHITSFHSQTIDQTLVLTSAETDLYPFLNQLFQGAIAVSSDGSAGASGSWTSITLTATNSTASEYTAPMISGSNSNSFDSLYQFVTSNLNEN